MKTSFSLQLNLKVKPLVTVQVKSIGDAFLVVSDVLAPSDSDVEQIADTALLILDLSRNVACPFDYGDNTAHVKVFDSQSKRWNLTAERFQWCCFCSSVWVRTSAVQWERSSPPCLLAT